MPSVTPAASQRSTSRVAAAVVRSTGFSIRMCRPAAAQRSTSSARASGGVRRSTASAPAMSPSKSGAIGRP